MAKELTEDKEGSKIVMPWSQSGAVRLFNGGWLTQLIMDGTAHDLGLETKTATHIFSRVTRIVLLSEQGCAPSKCTSLQKIRLILEHTSL